MRSSKGLLAGLGALALVALPVGAEAATVVTKVHGPLKILPHHNRKYCRYHWHHHKHIKKCWYH